MMQPVHTNSEESDVQLTMVLLVKNVESPCAGGMSCDKI